MKSTDRYCFLDIDEVLNSGRGREAMFAGIDVPIVEYCRGDFVEQEKLHMFQRFVKKWDLKIIGVSSWFTYPKDNHEDIGRVLELPIIATGYSTGGGLERGRGVLKWVADHGMEKWFVLDDAGHHMYDFDHNMVVVDGYHGLRGGDLSLAEKWIR